MSCSYKTRETFDLAVALLHSFKYAEAEKAFVKVIDADPNCPMAYLGVAKRIEKKMEQIYLKYPEDVEAAIFYLLALFSIRDKAGKEYINERKARKILESIF